MGSSSEQEPDRGVLYLAIGASYVDEARDSMRSLRNHVDLPVAIVTDQTDSDLSDFDHVIKISGKKQVERKKGAGETWLWDTTIDPDWSPFSETLFLDTDTYICEDISEIFDVLEDHDIAVVKLQWNYTVDTIPEPRQRQYNTGVLAFRDSDATRQLFWNWSRIFEHRVKTQERPLDQPAFREAVYVTEVKVFELPRRYNIRYGGYRSGIIADDPKIIHGRGEDPNAVAESLRGPDTQRVYRATTWGKPFTLRTAVPVSRTEEIAHRLTSPINGFRWYVENEGVRSALNRTAEYIRNRLPSIHNKKNHR